MQFQQRFYKRLQLDTSFSWRISVFDLFGNLKDILHLILRILTSSSCKLIVHVLESISYFPSNVPYTGELRKRVRLLQRLTTAFINKEPPTEWLLLQLTSDLLLPSITVSSMFVKTKSNKSPRLDDYVISSSKDPRMCVTNQV